MCAKIKKDRDSNFELLRIIAMILVLGVHANFLSIGRPTFEEFETNPSSTGFRIFAQSLCIICVNVFILLSGWYGIKPKIEKLCDFLFQIFFFSIFIFIISAITNPKQTLCLKGFLALFLLDKELWFVKAYLLLFFCSPMINLFIEKSSSKQIGVFLIAFYTFQLIFGWFITSVVWFDGGYSTLSFIGLYVLAGYIRKSELYLFRFKGRIDFFIYFILILLISLFATFLISQNYKGMMNKMFWYNSPLVILASIYFFLFFSKIKLHNKTINYIAISSFAIYLLHANPLIINKYYIQIIKHWYTTESTYTFLGKTLFYIICIFVISILLDKIRISLYSLLKKIPELYMLFFFAIVNLPGITI